MEYSVPYILLMGFYGLMAWWYQGAEDDNTRRTIKLLCAGMTQFFWGFRGFCFFDWMSYYPIFAVLEPSKMSDPANWTTEPGFRLLMALCKAITTDYSFFIFTCTLINVVFLSRFLSRHVDNFPLGMMFCMAIGGFGLFSDLLRNAIALFIFINALDYIKERRPWPYFSLCAVALLFHTSSLVYIPFYFFAHRRMKKWVFTAVFASGCLVYALRIPLLIDGVTYLLEVAGIDASEKLYSYLVAVSKTPPPLNFVFLERLLTGTLTIIYMDKLRSIRKDADVYINSLLLFLALNLFIYEFETISVRTALLFSFGCWIVWNDLLKCFSYDTNRKLFLLFLSAYCMLRVIGFTKNSRLAKYDNVLFDSETYLRRKSMFDKIFED